MIDNSPRPIAAFHVLHRLIMPKASTVRPSQTTQNTKTPTHQPHINNKHVHDSQRVNNNDFKQKITKKKILASTIQFSNNTNTHKTTTHNQPHRPATHHHFGGIPHGTTDCPRHPTAMTNQTTTSPTQPQHCANPNTQHSYYLPHTNARRGTPASTFQHPTTTTEDD